MKKGSITCRYVQSAAVHGSREDLVTEEVVSEQTAVGVWSVMTVLYRNIGQISEQSLHGVVLSVGVIDMAVIFVNSIVSNNSLEN